MLKKFPRSQFGCFSEGAPARTSTRVSTTPTLVATPVVHNPEKLGNFSNSRSPPLERILPWKFDEEESERERERGTNSRRGFVIFPVHEIFLKVIWFSDQTLREILHGTYTNFSRFKHERCIQVYENIFLCGKK